MPVFSDAIWRPMGLGLSSPVLVDKINNTAYSTIFHQGSIYVAGRFRTAGDATVNGICRWDGAAWQPLSTGPGGFSAALASSGDDLIVGGFLLSLGTIPWNHIARWSGTEWQPIGDSSVVDELVNDIEIINGTIYAGGYNKGGVAQYRDQTWSVVGGGIGIPVDALASDGRMLFVCGRLTIPGTSATAQVARWDGLTWTPMAPPFVSVTDLLWDGQRLIAIGGGISRWNGLNWESIAPGIAGIKHIIRWGSGYVATGQLADSEATWTSSVAVWDGIRWYPVGSRLDGDIHALTWSPGGLVVVGDFLTAGGIASSQVAMAAIPPPRVVRLHNVEGFGWSTTEGGPRRQSEGYSEFEPLVPTLHHRFHLVPQSNQ